jgi:hypothetical protein
MKACILSMLLLQSCLASATAFVCSPLGDSARRHVQACGTQARRQRAGVSMGGVGVPGGESLAEQEYDVPVGCRRLRIPTVCRRFKRTVRVAYTPVCLPFSRSRSLARSLCLSLFSPLHTRSRAPYSLLPPSHSFATQMSAAGTYSRRSGGRQRSGGQGLYRGKQRTEIGGQNRRNLGCVQVCVQPKKEMYLPAARIA